MAYPPYRLEKRPYKKFKEDCLKNEGEDKILMK